MQPVRTVVSLQRDPSRKATGKVSLKSARGSLQVDLFFCSILEAANFPPLSVAVVGPVD